MTAHDHRTFVEGCYRCDLSRDEVEQVDLDALEALYRDDKKRPVGTIGQADVLALIAELRQERERADKYQDLARRTELQCQDAEAALARAEETVDKVRNLERHKLNALVTAVDAQDIDAILTEYDKRKGADRD